MSAEPLEGLRVGVVGATGAVGQEVVRTLDRANWRPAEIVALARATTATSHVEYGDVHVPVDDVGDEAWEGLDAAILAVPPDAAVEVAPQALDEGVMVVDVSGALRREMDAPLVVPWVNPQVLLEGRPMVITLPSSGALMLASVLGPLRRAGLHGVVRATILEPASSRGRAGIDELAGQVRALFNSETPPRKVFSAGLAFDLLPEAGEPGAVRESAVGGELMALLGPGAEAPEVNLVTVPVFSGISAFLTVETGRQVDAALVEQLLRDGGVGVTDSARALPRPRRVEGTPFAQVGPVRVGADGALRLWVSMDNLKTMATAAVAAAGALLKMRAS